MTTPFPFASPQLDMYKEATLKNLQTNIESLHQMRDNVATKYVEPAREYVAKKAESRPVSTALLAVFFACALLPTAGFLLFSISTLATFLAISLIVSSFFIGIAGLFLLGTLFGAACFTFFVVFWGGIALASCRLLVILVTAPSLPVGLKTFEDEARRTLALPARDSMKTESN